MRNRPSNKPHDEKWDAETAHSQDGDISPFSIFARKSDAGFWVRQDCIGIFRTHQTPAPFEVDQSANSWNNSGKEGIHDDKPWIGVWPCKIACCSPNHDQDESNVDD